MPILFDQLAPDSLVFATTPKERPTTKAKYRNVETTRGDGQRAPPLQLTKNAPLRAPFGLSKPFAGDEGGNLSLEVSAPPTIASWVTEVEKHLVTTAVKHSKAWFGKELSEATVRAMHKPLLTKSDKHGLTLRLKVNPNSVELWDLADRAPVAMDALKAKGVQLVPIATLGDVWLNEHTFGLSLGMQIALVAKPAPSLGVDSFIDLEPMEE